LKRVGNEAEHLPVDHDRWRAGGVECLSGSYVSLDCCHLSCFLIARVERLQIGHTCSRCQRREGYESKRVLPLVRQVVECLESTL